MEKLDSDTRARVLNEVMRTDSSSDQTAEIRESDEVITEVPEGQEGAVEESPEHEMAMEAETEEGIVLPPPPPAVPSDPEE